MFSREFQCFNPQLYNKGISLSQVLSVLGIGYIVFIELYSSHPLRTLQRGEINTQRLLYIFEDPLLYKRYRLFYELRPFRATLYYFCFQYTFQTCAHLAILASSPLILYIQLYTLDPIAKFFKVVQIVFSTLFLVKDLRQSYISRNLVQLV